MSYRALYRKYRPDTFDEVVGQDHVVTTLQNEIKADRIAHAYLFTGTRGTGKTSAAKIFAKAVNCEDPQDGNPCGHCASCRAIASGSSMNVIEIDAASNNGVDNIRQIRDEVAYSPTEGKYKVYIIDEVHMLSASAFNALLKTLEEPPAYVIFILATTDVQKLPVTIISRCQRFDFKRIGQDIITERLTDLLEREQIEAEEKAVRYIARKAEGGMRDALSLLDQCISFYLNQRLTYEQVLKLLGAVDTERIDGLYVCIQEGDVSGVFTRLDDMIADGRDVSMIAADLTEHLRNILLWKTTEGAEDLLDLSEENRILLQADAERSSGETLIRYIRVMTETVSAMRYAVNKRIVLETALIRLCRPAMETDTASLAQRIRRLEKLLESGTFVQASAGAPAPGQSTVQASAASAAEPEREPAPYVQAVPQDLQRVRSEWKSILSGLTDKPRIASLQHVELRFDPTGRHDGEIYVITQEISGEWNTHDPAAQQQLKVQLEQLIEDRIGKRIAVHLLTEAEADKTGGQTISEREAIDAAAQAGIHMEVEFE